jgi:hypothetical protein
MRYFENRMRPPLQSDLLFPIYQKLQQSLNFLRKRVAARTAMLWMLGFRAIGSVTVLAQDNKFVLDRDGRTIVLEPYAPNILRITLSKDNATATGAPGYGIVGTPSMTGWAHEKDSEGNDVFRSSRLVIQVSADHCGTVGNYEDYPELFVRWFEWGAFQPVMRAHGERNHNEVWSYGKEAGPILEKYLRLRYQLLPYIYSIAYGSYETGAPFMRALFMDFPNDPNVADIRDEYMFGPAFLVAPVTEQGATQRSVYLPAGCEWYNYWTNNRVKGGQTITVNAPIDTIPLFVRAGSIVPLGSPVESAQRKQAIASVRVYPGADASFTLFSDDGNTYSYEKGVSSITKLSWDEASHQLKHDGATAWSRSDKDIVELVGR